MTKKTDHEKTGKMLKSVKKCSKNAAKCCEYAVNNFFN